jgi:hypothetical protein
MRHLAWLLAAILALAFTVSPAAAQCNCANSSLMGTTVNTSAGVVQLNPANVVSSGVEIPTAALVLFPSSSGTSPRLTVDYGANTIRVTFIQQTQGYGTGSIFTFSNLNPAAPAGCTGTPQIASMTVQTNNTSAASLVAGATSSAHSVSVPYGQPSNTIWQPGDFILVTLQFACSGGPPSFDPCCPPWNAAQLKAHLFYQGTGGIAAPYTLKFLTSAALNAQMNTYVSYLQSLGLGFTSLTLQFEVLNAGSGTTAVPTGTPISTGTATWTGSGSPTVVPAGFFLPANLMNAGPLGPWYRIRTTIVLNGGPGSAYLPASCLVSFTDVRVQVP